MDFFFSKLFDLEDEEKESFDPLRSTDQLFLEKKMCVKYKTLRY